MGVDLRPDGRSSKRWLQTMRALEEATRRGKFQSGDRVPSERELADQFGVSRVTVRRALSELASRGVLRRDPRRGWFIPTDLRITDAPLLQGLGEMADQAGLRSEATVLTRLVRPATVDEAETFAIAPGMQLFELHRFQRLEGLPHSVSEELVPLAFAPDLAGIDFDLPGASFLTALEQAVGGISHAQHNLDAIAADEQVATLLELRVGEPVLRNRERIYDLRGRLVAKTEGRARGDRVRYKAVKFRSLPATLGVDLNAAIEPGPSRHQLSSANSTD